MTRTMGLLGPALLIVMITGGDSFGPLQKIVKQTITQVQTFKTNIRTGIITTTFQNSTYFSSSTYNNNWPGWKGASDSLNKQLLDSMKNEVKRGGPSKPVEVPATNLADAFRDAGMAAIKQSQRTDLDTLEDDSTGGMANAFATTREESRLIAEDANTLEEFSDTLARTTLQGLTPKAAGRTLAKLTLPEDLHALLPSQQSKGSRPPVCDTILQGNQEKPVVPIADWQNAAIRPECAKTKYRNYTGYCNNIAFPDRGSESTVFLRRLEPEYSPTPKRSSPRQSVLEAPLPGARDVSNLLVKVEVNPNPELTEMFMQFGQFLDHDLTSTPRAEDKDGKTPKCCGVSKDKMHAECFPIDLPADDVHYSQFHQTCLEFVRSLPGITGSCQLGYREQMNQQTAYIDGSQVYGATEKIALGLREMDGGRLKVAFPFPEDAKYALLPGADLKSGPCLDFAEDKKCLDAGDGRCNVHIGLQSMHTVFVRYHNHLVEQLGRINGAWDDEKLYQEARAIVAAQLQHITYKEWLPILVGETKMKEKGLALLSNGRYKGYNVSADASLTNEFSGAAFRFGHAMVSGHIFQMSTEFQQLGSLKMGDTFFRSNRLYEKGTIEAVLRGLTGQPGKRMGNSITPELGQRMFNSPKSPQQGLDLISLNIQRGRDHGLPGWMKWRRLCGLPTVDSFDELKRLGAMPRDISDKFALIYKSIEDIDLYPAGIAETATDGGVIGPTFSCIITEQFARLRSGDRFWYENDVKMPSRLTDAQLAAIRSTTLATIFCQSNSGIDKIQPDVFKKADESGPNERFWCSMIPSIDVTPWTGV
ncbi:Peroxidasin-like protein [Hypsibius exemplaris]|uniref:Peroxidasin-like protein n=1 Tax=Hypsibius exemplaris TaxID=2072580 RepID=A0A9X6NDG6_HYPEX|nr:Peroxidasin-like protein [Hypsibius exemplaris]